MENTEKFRMRKYSKHMGTTIYAAGIREHQFRRACNVSPINMKYGRFAFWITSRISKSMESSRFYRDISVALRSERDRSVYFRYKVVIFFIMQSVLRKKQNKKQNKKKNNNNKTTTTKKTTTKNKQKKTTTHLSSRKVAVCHLILSTARRNYYAPINAFPQREWGGVGDTLGIRQPKRSLPPGIWQLEN